MLCEPAYFVRPPHNEVVVQGVAYHRSRTSFKTTFYINPYANAIIGCELVVEVNSMEWTNSTRHNKVSGVANIYLLYI